MKGKDKKTMTSKTVAELVALLKEKRNELMKTHMDLAMNKIKNVHAAKLIRRDIRILETIKQGKEATKNG